MFKEPSNISCRITGESLRDKLKSLQCTGVKSGETSRVWPDSSFLSKKSRETEACLVCQHYFSPTYLRVPKTTRKECCSRVSRRFWGGREIELLYKRMNGRLYRRLSFTHLTTVFTSRNCSKKIQTGEAHLRGMERGDNLQHQYRPVRNVSDIYRKRKNETKVAISLNRLLAIVMTVSSVALALLHFVNQ